MKIVLFLLLLALGASALNVSPLFSQNACIVIGASDEARCKTPVPENSTFAIASETQVVFSRIDDAIRYCPFSPTLVEFSGVVVSEGNITYPKEDDLIIRGVLDENEEPAVFVGLTNLRARFPSSTIKLQNFVAAGCDTEEPVFAGSRAHEGCLVERTVVISNVAFNYYTGERVLCQVSYSGDAYFEVTDTAFYEIQHAAIQLYGTQPYKIHDNFFWNCGYAGTACVLIANEGDDYTPGEIYNNTFYQDD